MCSKVARLKKGTCRNDTSPTHARRAELVFLSPYAMLGCCFCTAQLQVSKSLWRCSVWRLTGTGLGD